MTVILAKSSTGGSYEVRFENVDGCILTRCTCPAGEQQQFCKHLAAFFSGDCSMLFDSGQQTLLEDSLRILEASGILSSYLELQADLHQLDLELSSVKKRVDKERKERKARFMRKLGEGYPSQ